MNYQLVRPRAAAPGEKFPLVIFLHGAGERGSDNLAQLAFLPELLCLPQYREKYPCFILAPQCPQKWKEADCRWVDVFWHVIPSTPFDKEPGPAMQALMDLVWYTKFETLAGQVDLDRVYLTGLSMGGFGVWDLAMRMPDRFACVVPICGGGDERNVQDLYGLPIWAFHGALDKTVPPERSRTITLAVQAVNATEGHPADMCKYTEYPDEGHQVQMRAYKDAIPWMFDQRK